MRHVSLRLIVGVALLLLHLAGDIRFEELVLTADLLIVLLDLGEAVVQLLELHVVKAAAHVLLRILYQPVHILIYLNIISYSHCRGVLGFWGHRRERVFVLAYADGVRLHNIYDSRVFGENEASFTGAQRFGSNWWQTEPDLGRMAHGLPNQLDRIRALGNGAVPLVVAIAFRELIARAERRLRV